MCHLQRQGCSRTSSCRDAFSVAPSGEHVSPKSSRVKPRVICREAGVIVVQSPPNLPMSDILSIAPQFQSSPHIAQRGPRHCKQSPHLSAKHLQALFLQHWAHVRFTQDFRGLHDRAPCITRHKTGNLLHLCSGQVEYLLTCSSTPSRAEERRLQRSVEEWSEARARQSRSDVWHKVPWSKVTSLQQSHPLIPLLPKPSRFGWAVLSSDTAVFDMAVSRVRPSAGSSVPCR